LDLTGFTTTALYTLSAPEVPQSARDEAIDRGEHGEHGEHITKTLG
jgi:hypothetical protein